MREAEQATAMAAVGDQRVAGGSIVGLAFDLDGTVYLGTSLLPGAAALMRALADQRVPYLYATNNSSCSTAQVLERLAALGLAATAANVLTSNDVAAAVLADRGLRRPYLLATPEVAGEYRARGILPSESDPDAVVLTFDTTLTYDKLRRASDLIRAGLPYYATHPDKVCPTPSGPIPDCGAFAALLAEATGAWPTVLGKPERFMAEAIRERLGVPPARIAFVGDRLYTDVRMANDHGFLAVLTLTGEATRDDLVGSPHQPDLVVDDLVALHAHLRRAGPLA